jgi:hypothetical protein
MPVTLIRPQQTAVEELVDTTIVDVPEPPTMVLGVNVAVVPAGKLVAESVTFWVKPEPGITAI